MEIASTTDVIEQCGGRDQVGSDGCEVERRDGIDEAFERTPVGAANSIVNEGVTKEPGQILPSMSLRIELRLIIVNLLSRSDIESMEVSRLRCNIDLDLPSILALTQHSRSHQLESVLAGN